MIEKTEPKRFSFFVQNELTFRGVYGTMAVMAVDGLKTSRKRQKI